MAELGFLSFVLFGQQGHGRQGNGRLSLSFNALLKYIVHISLHCVFNGMNIFAYAYKVAGYSHRPY